MAKLKTWIRAARPRTVLLSFSGVLLGGALSVAASRSDWLVILFCAITAILLQVLSNLANDYGDFKKGTDSAKRVGPQREMQSGTITEKEMKRGLFFTAAICLISGALLIFVFAKLAWQELAVFAALGIGSVLAALFYTLGKRPYGYRGLGDLFCFLFFGGLPWWEPSIWSQNLLISAYCCPPRPWVSSPMPCLTSTICATTRTTRPRAKTASW